MELRVLQYFLAVAREQSISGAAEFLHLTQPTLSRQIKDLEEELGKQLFVRGNRRVTLTEEGMLLRKRAEEIVDLLNKTEREILHSDKTVTGDIYIGAGETDSMRIVARAARKIQEDFPGVHFHISSGDACDILEKLDKGLLDFSVLLGDIDKLKYDYLEFPMKDTWGILMRRDSPLAAKESVTAEDLRDLPLIISRQAQNKGDLLHWLSAGSAHPNIAATYNLIYNAALMVDEGMGYAFSLDKLTSVGADSNLLFRPLSPPLHLGMTMIWKKYQIFPRAAELFLTYLRRELTAG